MAISLSCFGVKLSNKLDFGPQWGVTGTNQSFIVSSGGNGVI